MLNGIKRKLMISFLTLLVLLIIYLIPTNKDIEILKENNEIKTQKVFLLNNNLLVETDVISKNNIDIISQAKDIIDSLTIGGSKSNYLKKDMEELIPLGTKVYDVSLSDGILKINFSKEFYNVSERLEEKVVEALVYSLTNLNDVKGIMIFVEGSQMQELIHSKRRVPLVLTKDYGINKIYDITSLSNVTKSTLYYYTNIDNDYGVVPVTIFSNDDINKVEVIIETLKSSPIYQSNLMSFLSNNAKLLDYELKENAIKLSFENSLLDTFFDDSLIEEVKYAISMSLKDTLGVSEVIFSVNGQNI